MRAASIETNGHRENEHSSDSFFVVVEFGDSQIFVMNEHFQLQISNDKY